MRAFGIFKLLTLSSAVLLGLTACASLDVVGNQSAASFGAVLEALPEKVTKASDRWVLIAPDESSYFIWSEDYSKSPLTDISLRVDAQPFLDAGLDVAKLPEEYTYSDGTLAIGTKLGDDQINYKGEPTPLAAYEQLAKRYPDTIGYHAQLDHFGVTVAEGNVFEWAKDMSTNDKDIVFVLNPQPLIEAGVDPEAVEGWLFAKVTMDMNGKTVEMEKFLKPFDLK